MEHCIIMDLDFDRVWNPEQFDNSYYSDPNYILNISSIK